MDQLIKKHPDKVSTIVSNLIFECAPWKDRLGSRWLRARIIPGLAKELTQERSMRHWQVLTWLNLALAVGDPKNDDALFDALAVHLATPGILFYRDNNNDYLSYPSSNELYAHRDDTAYIATLKPGYAMTWMWILFRRKQYRRRHPLNFRPEHWLYRQYAWDIHEEERLYDRLLDAFPHLRPRIVKQVDDDLHLRGVALAYPCPPMRKGWPSSTGE